MTNWLLWQQLRAAAGLHDLWQGRTCALPHSTDPDDLTDATVILELAQATGISETVAASRLNAAKVLITDGRLPQTAALLQDGRLDWPRLNILLTRAQTLTPDQADALEDHVYATRGVLSLGLGRFTALVDHTLETLDQHAAEQRRNRARRHRRIGTNNPGDGTATLYAIGPPDAITAAYSHLDTAARHLRTHGDPRTLDQLRFDLLTTAATTGAATATCTGTTGSGTGTGTGTDTTGTTTGTGTTGTTTGTDTMGGHDATHRAHQNGNTTSGRTTNSDGNTTSDTAASSTNSDGSNTTTDSSTSDSSTRAGSTRGGSTTDGNKGNSSNNAGGSARGNTNRGANTSGNAATASSISDDNGTSTNPDAGSPHDDNSTETSRNETRAREASSNETGSNETRSNETGGDETRSNGLDHDGADHDGADHDGADHDGADRNKTSDNKTSNSKTGGRSGDASPTGDTSSSSDASPTGDTSRSDDTINGNVLAPDPGPDIASGPGIPGTGTYPGTGTRPSTGAHPDPLSGNATGTRPRITDTSSPTEPPPWLTTPMPAVTSNITITISLETLIGLNNDPAHLDHYGPVAAALARDLATHATWRCIATDPTHGTVAAVAHRTHTASSTGYIPGYRPTPRQRIYLSYASPTCTVARCTTPSHHCDLDHTTPHARGGATCLCNLHPLCRRHHRLKTAGHITLTPATPEYLARHPDLPPGTLVLTTRTGRRYPTPPHTPLPHSSPTATAAEPAGTEAASPEHPPETAPPPSRGHHADGPDGSD